MRGHRPKVVIALLLSAGCANLSPLEIDQCDNGVIEPTEDCDRFADAHLGAGLRCAKASEPNACHYVCSDGSACPLGWGCGKDDRCRAPSGQFEVAPESPQAFESLPPESFAAGDIDGDGRADLIASFPARVEWSTGDGTGRFQLARALDALPATGEISLANLDGDAFADSIRPTPQGLAVWRGRSGAAPVEVAYAALPLPPGGAWILPLDTKGKDPLDVVIYSSAESTLIRLVDTARGTFETDEKLVDPSNNLEKLAGPPVIADFDADGNDDVALAFVGSNVVRVYAIFHGGFSPKWAIRDPKVVDLGGRTVAQGVLSADVDGDGALDLLASTDDDRVFVALGDGEGGLGIAAQDDRFDALAVEGPEVPGFQSSNSRWPLAMADFDADGLADCVGPNGIYFAAKAGNHPFSQIQPREDLVPWTDVTVADLDSDGAKDLVAITKGVPVASILRCVLETGVCTSFVSRRYALDSGARAVRSGKLLGNPGTDVVIAEQPRSGATEDALVLLRAAYRDWPSEPELITLLDPVAHLEVGRSAFPGWPTIDSFDDVLVTCRHDDATQSFGVLFGTGSERLESTYYLGDGSVPLAPSIPNRIVPGSFGGASDGSGLGLAVLGTSSYHAPELWLLAASARADFAPSAMPADLRDSFGDDFDLDCASFAAGDLDHDGIDELAIAYGGGLCPDAASSLALAVGRVSETSFEFQLEGSPFQELAPKRLVMPDLDADGSAELVLVGTDRVHVLWNGAVADDTLAIPEAAGQALDARSLTTTQSGKKNVLAVLGEHGLVLFRSDRARHVSSRFIPGPAHEVDAADIDADGLSDLLIFDGQSIRTLRAIPARPLGGP